MNRLKEILSLVVLGIVAIPFVILFILYHILNYPSRFLAQKNFERGYLQYTHQLNNKNFFCYNNREESKEFIENYVIPKLPKSIEIIFLNGRLVESNYSREFMSQAFYRFKHYNKFPHLMKIRNGEIIDTSINNTFYNVLNDTCSLEKLLDEVNLFFKDDGQYQINSNV